MSVVSSDWSRWNRVYLRSYSNRSTNSSFLNVSPIFVFSRGFSPRANNISRSPIAATKVRALTFADGHVRCSTMFLDICCLEHWLGSQAYRVLLNTVAWEDPFRWKDLQFVTQYWIERKSQMHEIICFWDNSVSLLWMKGSMWKTPSKQKRNSPMRLPWWTRLEDGKKRIEWDPGSRHAWGYMRKLSTAPDKTTCGITDSSISDPSWKLSFGFACEDALEDYVWCIRADHIMSGSKVLEDLSCVAANLCVVQCGMLWFSAPRLNSGFLDERLIQEMYNKVVHLVLVATLSLPCWGLHTPRIFFLRSTRTVLIRFSKRNLHVES